MSRTRIRVVFFLVILILVIASILSSLLTRWVGAGGEPSETPSGGESVQILGIAVRVQIDLRYQAYQRRQPPAASGVTI